MELAIIIVVVVIGVVAGPWLTVRAMSRVAKPAEQPEDKSFLMLQEQLSKLTERVDDRLDKSNEQMQTAIRGQFAASSKLIGEVTRDLTQLKESNKQVLSITDELKLLQNTLQNPKQRGVLGEYFLQTVLENVLPPERFELQARIGRDDDGKELIADAIIRLDKGKILPIDSKFSLENYNRLVEERDKTRQDALVRAIKNDLKARIDETAKYIRPADGTMDFAFMFIPSEAVYYDLLINKVGTLQTNARDLIEYAFRDKHVIIVSPTSFMAYLQTVLQGLRSLQIEGRAKDIEKRVGELGRHLIAHETYMQKLGNSLGTTVNHYNAAHKELAKVDKDVVKIADTTPGIVPLLVDKPQENE
jgi:DNA recombination protein RmuC